MKKEDILDLAIERYKAAHDDDEEEARLALDDLLFEDNKDNYQWPSEIKQQREADSPPRPCLSLNKITEKIDLVEGEFRQLQPSVKVRPVDSVADPKIAEIRAGLFRHIEYSSIARTIYNNSHATSLRCGRGSWRIDIENDIEDPFVRNIVINPIPNVFSVKVDPNTKKLDRSDAQYVFVTEEIPIKEFEKEYPDVNLYNWPDDITDKTQLWHKEKKVRIAEYWWKEKVKKTFYRINKNGNEYTLSEDKILEGDIPFVVEEKEASVPQVKWCLMTYADILEGPYDWPTKDIPIIIESGKEVNIGGVTKRKGMVRNAKTPQQMYNYWSSSITEQIALVPKVPYLLTASMISKHKRIWDLANAKNFPYLPYDVDPTAPTLYPKREMPPQLSPALSHELARMEHDIMSAMGLYNASLGDTGEEKSGKAILARQKQGSLGTYVYTSNFQTALIYSTKIVMDLIPYVYDTERIARILGPDGTELAVPINMRPQSELLSRVEGLSDKFISNPKEGVTGYINDLSVGKYDIIISIGAAYDTQRQEALEMLMELVKHVPGFAEAAIDLIVKNIDIPGSEEIMERAKKLIPQGIREPDPGELPPEPQPPPPEQVIEMKKLELAALEEMRKGFEAKVDAIAKIMNAEAKERGQQFTEIKGFIDAMQQEQQAQQPQNQGETI